MANPNPDLYIIRVSASPVVSPTTNRTLSGALQFAVSRRADCGKGRARKVDLDTLVVRPGDSITFELGDLPFRAKSPELRIKWKFPTGKRWKNAPKKPGDVAQIPPGEGFGGMRFSFDAKIDLNIDNKLPAQSVSRGGTTVLQLDPDVVVDEC
jgi:hypothetical protein